MEALRSAGIDAHYAYVGGYKLQTKLAPYDFAHPSIEKAQNPVSFSRTVRELGRLVADHRIDVVHAHLTYDHWLARFVSRTHRVRIARTFHARRVLRDDPFTRSLIRATDLLFTINERFADTRALAARHVTFTPPPVDHRQFHRNGPDVRAAYGISAATPLLAVIGKLAPDRGFEEALQTFAAVRRSVADARLMIIGHGEHRAVLEQLAAELALTRDVIWAGYHEDDLAEHYRAADALLFTAKGSDEGHRAILEAMACGTPPVSFPIEGVAALLGELASSLMATAKSADALASVAAAVLQKRAASLRSGVAARSEEFGYGAAARRLIAAYDVR